MPRKQPKRRSLWLKDSSCVRLRPERRNHVWRYDFTAGRTSDGRPLRFLAILDEYTRECLALVVGRSLTSEDVLYALWRLFITRGLPDFIRSDNGSEFTANRVRDFLGVIGVKTLYIEPGSPWENGYYGHSSGSSRTNS